MKSSFSLFQRLYLGCGVTCIESRGLLIMNTPKVVALCSTARCSAIPQNCEEYESESLRNDTCCAIYYLVASNPRFFHRNIIQPYQLHKTSSMFYHEKDFPWSQSPFRVLFECCDVIG